MPFTPNETQCQATLFNQKLLIQEKNGHGALSGYNFYYLTKPW